MNMNMFIDSSYRSRAQFSNNQRVLFARSPDFKLQAQLALKCITGNPIII